MSTIKKVFTGALVLMLCSNIVGCTQVAQEAVSDPAIASLDFSAGGPGDPNTPKPLPPNIEIEEFEFEFAPVKLNPALIYQTNETISEDSLSEGLFEFSNPKCYRATELPADIDVDKMMYFDGDLIDGTTDLVEGKEYVFVDIDIYNTMSAEKSFNVGSMNFILTDSDLIETEILNEPRYFSAGANMKSKSYFNLVLAGKEKITITLGYIMETSVLDAHSVYYSVSEAGRGYSGGGNTDEPEIDERQCFAMQFS